MRRQSGTLERLYRPLFGILKQTLILFIYLFIWGIIFCENWVMRIYFERTGWRGIYFWENWVARDLFLRELGIAELIFARTGWRGTYFYELAANPMRILNCFRVILESKAPFLIENSNVSEECPFCIKLSVKKFKSFQNLLLDNPAVFFEFF